MCFRRRSITPLQNPAFTVFPSGMNFLCAMPWESKIIINMVMMRDLWNFSSFSQGDVSPTPSELCWFVSGSQAKYQVTSPIIIFVKKKNFLSAIAIMSWQDVTWSFLCSGVKDCGIKCANKFLFPKSSFRIRRTTVLGMFKDSAIILDVIWQLFLTKSAAAAMLTSVRVDFGWPPLLSSSTSFLPSQNREYHLKTFDHFRASFPKAFCTNTSVSVADRPALEQNFMSTLFISINHDVRGRVKWKS